MGIWEQLYNSQFNSLEFGGGVNQAGGNAFTLSPLKWANSTNAIGIAVKAGRGGGTYAHKDIAFKFASWLSAEFELYVVKDYQRLMSERLVLLRNLAMKQMRTMEKLNLSTLAIADHNNEEST